MHFGLVKKAGQTNQKFRRMTTIYHLGFDLKIPEGYQMLQVLEENRIIQQPEFCDAEIS